MPNKAYNAYLMYARLRVVVGAPYTKSDIERLEAVQRWAARFVMSDYNQVTLILSGIL